MPEHFPFSCPSLPYDYISLNPVVAPDTLYLHHVKLLGGYVQTLNYLLAALPQYQNHSLEQLVSEDLELPPVLRNNVRHYAGGIYAHDFFFDGMCPPQEANVPFSQLGSRLEAAYGSFGDFQKRFKEAAFNLLGSGWVWLVCEPGGELHIVLSPNHEIPDPALFRPLLAFDKWEHAYFCRFPADLGGWVDNWFTAVDWAKAERRFLRATQ